LRIKKQREDKARFLREQNERRQFEAERARADEERRQRDAERRQWEVERLAWEKEKRAMEEERKRKLYAEEVAAARQRAESSRVGMRGSPSAASLQESSSASKRLSRGGLEPPPSPRRQASDPFPRDRSPSTPSIASGMGPYPISSRPSSIHSSENVLNNGPRSTAFYIPPVPPIPQFYPYPSGYAMDMPLLPPTAPFMVNQYSRRQSQSPQSSSRQRVHNSGSTESLSRQSVHGRQGSSPTSRDTSSSSLSASPHRTHQRRTSDDHSKRVSTHSLSPHSSSTHLPRGRSTNTDRVQRMESPWTAPPMLHGGFPSSSGIDTGTRHTPSRRQTTFS
jgi:hypothetical protein